MRKEPFITLFIGGVFISFIIYAAKPSHPLLSTVNVHQFTPSQFQRLSYHNGNLMHWATTNNQQQNSLDLSLNSTLIFTQELDPDHKPLFLFPFQDELALIYHNVNEETISYHVDYYFNNSLGYSIKSRRLPGNIRMTKCIVSQNVHLLYTNKFDKRLFRLLPNVLDDTTISIPGPLTADFPGRILTFAYLKPIKDEYRIIAVQYLSFERSVMFRVSVSMFIYTNNEWERDVLWETELAGLGGDFIDSDSVDYLYFLTNPVLAVSDTEDMVAFVFIEHLFTLSKHDGVYQLKTQPIYGLFGSDFDVDYIDISKTENGHLISLFKRIFVFTDKPAKEPPLKERVLDALIFLLSPGIVVEFLYLIFSEFEILFPSTESSLDTSQVVFPTTERTWRLLGTWSNDLVGESTNKILLVTGYSDPTTRLAVLLEDGRAFIIDPKNVEDTWPSLLFLKRRWPLLLSLFLIVLIFTINEFKLHHTPRSNFVFFSMVYAVLLMLTFGVVFVE